jgi:rhodanese-related sulfurtransferase
MSRCLTSGPDIPSILAGMVTSIEDLLARARARLSRVTPSRAFQEARDGAVLVDIRPAAQRREHGEIPESIVVERNHLEWRFDPASDARLPMVTGYEHRIIVFCQEGYTSSLAAAALQDLGLRNATDLDGGFAAWVAAGLPWAPGGQAGVLIAPGASAAV